VRSFGFSATEPAVSWAHQGKEHVEEAVMSQMSGKEPGNRPEADRSYPKEAEQFAQEQTYPGPTPESTESAETATEAAVGTEAPRDEATTDESTPHGLASEESTVPDPLEPVPGVEQGTRARRVSGESGEQDSPPLGDAEHGGVTPLEPPD
jgi:hypothetical protein